MSKAYWLFMFTGDADTLKRDVDAFVVPNGVILSFDYNNLTVFADDTELGGKLVMPYPNQIAFLDYITETEGYKTGVYQFANMLYIVPAGMERRWRLEDYLAEKAKR